MESHVKSYDSSWIKRNAVLVIESATALRNVSPRLAIWSRCSYSRPVKNMAKIPNFLFRGIRSLYTMLTGMMSTYRSDTTPNNPTAAFRLYCNTWSQLSTFNRLGREIKENDPRRYLQLVANSCLLLTFWPTHPDSELGLSLKSGHRSVYWEWWKWYKTPQ
jgi:hypothetical protein